MICCILKITTKGIPANRTKIDRHDLLMEIRIPENPIFSNCNDINTVYSQGEVTIAKHYYTFKAKRLLYFDRRPHCRPLSLQTGYITIKPKNFSSYASECVE